jgi:hypothetical protein
VSFNVFEQGAATTSPSKHSQVLANRWLGNPELACHLNLAESMTLDEFLD